MVERRGRLLVIAAGALLLALVVSSVANTSRVSLHCDDGVLVAHRGSLMPVGDEPLDDPSLPPLPVPMAVCEDEEFPDLATLRTRYHEIARTRMGEAMAHHPTAEPLEPATLDALAELPEDADEQTVAARRAMLRSIVDAKVEAARKSQQDAVRWIEQARRAGVDPAHLRAAERMLGLVPATRAPDEPDEPEPPAKDEQAPAEPTDAPRSRSL